jgi:hypothetical protein
MANANNGTSAVGEDNAFNVGFGVVDTGRDASRPPHRPAEAARRALWH